MQTWKRRSARLTITPPWFVKGTGPTTTTATRSATDMSDLTIDEMRIQAEQMSEQDLESLLASLQSAYPKKQVSLGHSLTEREEALKKVDMMSDNAYYMIAYKELIKRQRAKIAEAWKMFDDEAEDYIERVQRSIEQKYSPHLLGKQ